MVYELIHFGNSVIVKLHPAQKAFFLLDGLPEKHLIHPRRGACIALPFYKLFHISKRRKMQRFMFSTLKILMASSIE